MTQHRRRSPAKVADIVQTLTKYHQISDRLSAYSAFPHWEEIVGAEIAKIAKPEKINRRSILVVCVKNSAWVQELTLQKESILQKIAEFGMGAPVNDIQFVTRSAREK